MPLRVAIYTQDPWSYSLDRIDNKKGYVKGNVAVMSYKANRLKNDGTAVEHELIALWMRENMVSEVNEEPTALTRAADRVTIVI